MSQRRICPTLTRPAQPSQEHRGKKGLKRVGQGGRFIETGYREDRTSQRTRRDQTGGWNRLIELV